MIVALIILSTLWPDFSIDRDCHVYEWGAWGWWATAPDLYHVEDMAMVAQIPMPRVFIIEDSSLNAFGNRFKPAECSCRSHFKFSHHESKSWRLWHEVISGNYIAFDHCCCLASAALPFCLVWQDDDVGWRWSQTEDNDRDGNGLEIIMLVISLSHCSSTSAATLCN